MKITNDKTLGFESQKHLPLESSDDDDEIQPMQSKKQSNAGKARKRLQFESSDDDEISPAQHKKRNNAGEASIKTKKKKIVDHVEPVEDDDSQLLAYKIGSDSE